MVRNRSIWVLLLSVIFLVTALGVGDADAKRRKRKRGKKPVPAFKSKDHIKALKELMGAFKFGMSRDDVIEVVKTQISERYAEQISNTSDVYRQDELRRKRDKEIKRMRDSLVEFTGKRSGWDVSIIDDQFQHSTEESMLVYWENFQGRNQRRFFFFFEGNLYKMFIALDTSSMKLRDDQQNFEFFQGMMTARFGPGEKTDLGMTWKGRSFHLDALDKLSFYSSFCMVISDPRRTNKVLALRKERKKAPKPRNAIIQSVTETVDDGGPDLDEGAGVIDDILKK